MSRKRVFCVAIIVALLGGLVPQFIMPASTMAEEPEVSVTDTTTINVSSFEELLSVFDGTWDEDSGAIEIVLDQNIEQTYGDGDYLAVNLGWTVTLNLNGHSLTLRNDGSRGLINYGTLIVTGDGVILNGDTMNESYGLIDNYGGELVIENGTFIDYGQGGGAALKNRTVSFDGGTTITQGKITIKSGEIYSFATAGGNACIYTDGILNIYDGVTLYNEATDEIHNGYFGAYALIVSSGTATIGSTVGKTDNMVQVNGNRGALGVNSGTVIVNNGVFTGNKYYGMWITNNGNISNVTIEYAEATGGSYGVYSAVDDGKQDVSDASIVIKDGKYRGGTKAAVAVNASKSEHSFGMLVSGGEFSTEPDSSYIAEGSEVFDTSEAEYPYAVDLAQEVNFPDTIYIQKGGSYDLSDKMNSSARKYGTFSATDAVSLDGFVLTGETVGSGELQYALSRKGGTVPVVVYETTTSDDDESESETDAETVREYVDRQVADLIQNGEDTNTAIVLASGEIEGVQYEGVELVKAALKNDYTLETMLVSTEFNQEEWENMDAFDEILAELGEGEGFATIYDGVIALLATRDNEEVFLGLVLELEQPVTMSVEIPEDYLEAGDGISRTFYVVRGHIAKDGTKSAERLETVQNGKYLFFETDKLSTFAVTYVDVETETGIIVPNTGVFTRAINTTAPAKSNFDGLIGAIITMSAILVVAGALKGLRRVQRKVYRGE